MTRCLITLLCVAATFALVACKPKPVVITVSKAEIQEHLNGKFPVETSKYFIDVTLQNPDVILTPGSERIGLALDVVVKPPLVGPFGGKLAASGKLDYRSAEHAFYFLEPMIDRLDIAGLDPQYADKARAAAGAIALAYLTEHPVYEFRGRNLKEITAQWVLREVKVTNGELQAVIAPPL